MPASTSPASADVRTSQSVPRIALRAVIVPASAAETESTPEARASKRLRSGCITTIGEGPVVATSMRVPDGWVVAAAVIGPDTSLRSRFKVPASLPSRRPARSRTGAATVTWAVRPLSAAVGREIVVRSGRLAGRVSERRDSAVRAAAGSARSADAGRYRTLSKPAAACDRSRSARRSRAGSSMAVAPIRAAAVSSRATWRSRPAPTWAAIDAVAASWRC